MGILLNNTTTLLSLMTRIKRELNDYQLLHQRLCLIWLIKSQYTDFVLRPTTACNWKKHELNTWPRMTQRLFWKDKGLSSVAHPNGVSRNGRIKCHVTGCALWEAFPMIWAEVQVKEWVTTARKSDQEYSHCLSVWILLLRLFLKVSQGLVTLETSQSMMLRSWMVPAHFQVCL